MEHPTNNHTPEKLTTDQIIETLDRAKADLSHHPQSTVRLLYPFTLWLAKIGLKHRVNPNFLTLCMFLTVLVALPFFCFSNAVCAIVGLLLIQWFEIFDDADGIVARGTGQLSVYGEQLDYLMHLFCHPLSLIVYAFAVWRTLPSEKMLDFLPLSNAVLLTVLCSIFAVSEYGMRAVIELDAMTRLKRLQKNDTPDSEPMHGFRALIGMNLLCYPVFMQLFPVFLVIDAFASTHISFWIYGGFACLWLLFYLKHSAGRLLRFMRRA